MSEETDPSEDALDALQRRLQEARIMGPHGQDQQLQLDLLFYIGRELHELRKLIDAIDRGRSEL